MKLFRKREQGFLGKQLLVCIGAAVLYASETAHTPLQAFQGTQKRLRPRQGDSAPLVHDSPNSFQDSLAYS